MIVNRLHIYGTCMIEAVIDGMSGVNYLGGYY